MPLGIEQLVRGVHPNAVRGLFHGKQIQHGFRCVDKGKRPRTKRDWQPNVQYKFLYSEVLKRKLRLFVTTSNLRRIDRAGGLDMYLLTEPVAAHSSIVGEELRNVITKAYEAKGLALPKKEGTTSILSLVNERLQQAGLREAPRISPKPASVPVATPSSHSLQQPDDGGWAANVPVPHTETLKRKRQAPLHSKRFLTAGKQVSQQLRDAILFEKRAHARKVARRNGLIRTMRGQAHNHRLRVHALRKLRKDYRMMGSISRLHFGLVRKQVQLGRSTDESQQERLGQTIAKCRDRLHALRANIKPLYYGSLKNYVMRMTDNKQRAKWQNLLDKYLPTVPGLIVNGTFLPAANRHSGYVPDHAPLRLVDEKTASPMGMREDDLALGRRLRLATLQLTYGHRKKYAKIRKWLSDKWLKKHLVPETDADKLVLPNQMVLWSKRRRHSKGSPFATH